MKPLTKHSTPEFSEAQYEYLKRVFKQADVSPDTTLSQVMYWAGEQHVLDHIAQKVKVWTRRVVI